MASAIAPRTMSSGGGRVRTSSTTGNSMMAPVGASGSKKKASNPVTAYLLVWDDSQFEGWPPKGKRSSIIVEAEERRQYPMVTFERGK